MWDFIVALVLTISGIGVIARWIRIEREVTILRLAIERLRNESADLFYTCPHCGSHNSQKIDRLGSWDHMRCNDCQWEFVDVRSDPDESLAEWANHRKRGY